MKSNKTGLKKQTQKRTQHFYSTVDGYRIDERGVNSPLIDAQQSNVWKDVLKLILLTFNQPRYEGPMENNQTFFYTL